MMPVVLLDRLPLPSLEAYTVVSVLLLSCSLYYSIQVTSDPSWRLNYTKPSLSESETSEEVLLTFRNVTISGSEIFSASDFQSKAEWGFRPGEVVVFMFHEPLCIWTLINMAYCCLILLGKFIQKLVFGELRVSEQQHIKDKFWNFVFYKFIFIFGVVNVEFMDEVVLWCSWFSVLGFLHLLTQLCKDRFEYLSFSPTTPRWAHIRLLTLLGAILGVSTLLFLICILVGFYAGINAFAFMAAECVLLLVRTFFVMVRYTLHLYDVGHEGAWEQRGPFVYYNELIFELTALVIDLVHHLHMLLWGNIFLSMASLVICMQLRYLFHEIQRRLKKHQNYLRVVHYVQKNYPMALAEELALYADNCAICWDKLETARKLPCNHYFHNACLRSWLEQDTSCPTCRQVLSVDRGAVQTSSVPEPQEESLLAGFTFGSETEPVGQQPNRRTTNHFFHFDGSRYVSWLPSFSVEVTHTQLLRSDQPQHAQTSQLDTMARQVQQMFPHLSMASILEDLRLTRSVEATIENILEERIVPTPPMFQSDEEEIHPTPSFIPTYNQQYEEQQMQKYNYIKDDLKEEIIGVGEGSNLGGRFSKSSMEREQMLKWRREALILQARRRYLSKQSRHPSDEDEESS